MEPPTCVRRTLVGVERRQCIVEGTYVLRKGTATLNSGPFQAVNQQDAGTTVRPWLVSFTCQGRADYAFNARVQRVTYSISPTSVDVKSQVTATLC
ncbi:hypothetical protein [Nonomuraea sp. NPDC049400]|uniref:hypothetical protein n=1 Tax=Nonomuraea sp. NPDC049400 TaxID=3364352 RepID=UPI00379FD1A6